MRVLTYTSYKKHCELYSEIYGSAVINSCQIELVKIYHFTIRGLHSKL